MPGSDRIGLLSVLGALLLASGPSGPAAGSPPMASSPSPARPGPTVASRPRVMVLSDIGNEPDDSESMVRFLLYANAFDIEGLIATTSVWQRDRVQPALIAERIDAYDTVRPNLVHHADGYPTAASLRAVLRGGAPFYGMAGVGRGHDTDASRLIVAAADRADARPLWVLLWGGGVDLAQALWSVRTARTPAQVAAFVARLRVYSISDQDDTGPWIRRSFPDLFWIASIHAYGQYAMATWTGISADRRNGETWPDAEVVSDAWLAANIRRGPLGATYPLPKFIMEGDTPSFLYLIPNGLNDPQHPDHGGWGGRYMQQAPGERLFADVKDRVSRDGAVWTSNQASVFRWRRAFQEDFAARIGWTLTPDRRRANHPPQVVVQQDAGEAPVHIAARGGGTIRLDARGTTDPDGDALDHRWWQYREVGGVPGQPLVVISDGDRPQASLVVPEVTAPVALHIILELRDHGTPAITRYRRVIIDASPAR